MLLLLFKGFTLWIFPLLVSTELLVTFPVFPDNRPLTLGVYIILVPFPCIVGGKTTGLAHAIGRSGVFLRLLTRLEKKKKKEIKNKEENLNFFFIGKKLDKTITRIEKN